MDSRVGPHIHKYNNGNIRLVGLNKMIFFTILANIGRLLIINWPFTAVHSVNGGVLMLIQNYILRTKRFNQTFLLSY